MDSKLVLFIKLELPFLAVAFMLVPELVMPFKLQVMELTVAWIAIL